MDGHQLQRYVLFGRGITHRRESGTDLGQRDVHDQRQPQEYDRNHQTDGVVPKLGLFVLVEANERLELREKVRTKPMFICSQTLRNDSHISSQLCESHTHQHTLSLSLSHLDGIGRIVDKLDAISVERIFAGAGGHMQIAGRIVNVVRIFGICGVQYVALTGLPLDEAVLCVFVWICVGVRVVCVVTT